MNTAPELIEIGKIVPNRYQPRLQVDQEAVSELAMSIEANGLLQPPTARQIDGRYELAFGHNRLAAFILLNSQGRKNTGRCRSSCAT